MKEKNVRQIKCEQRERRSMERFEGGKSDEQSRAHTKKRRRNDIAQIPI